MSLPEQLTKLVQSTTGPSPWFWETFPEARGGGVRRYRWRFHGQEEGLNYLVTLHGEGEPDKPRLALNTLCRPFMIDEGRMGVWCPEGRELRFVCFELDRLQTFGLEEIAGWFSPSSERIYAATAPAGEFFVSINMGAGIHSIVVPECFRTLDELLTPTNLPTVERDDPALAIFVVYPQAGLLEVLPQNWITRVNYDLTSHWITRAARDPETHRIAGELLRVGVFELADNGRDFSRWL
jgi:hypothetical protein